MSRASMALVSAVLLLGAVVPGTMGSAQHDKSIAGVQKVLQMLADMAQAGKKAKNEEEIAFAKFDTWCTMEQAALKKAIKQETETIELLGASITKLTSDANTLADEVATLKANVASFESDIKAANEERAKTNKAYIEEVTDYSESVDALERAIAALERQNFDRPGDAKAALTQLAGSPKFSTEVKSMISAFLGMSDAPADESGGFMDRQAPEANAYEFQSGGVITMLKRLLDDFRQKKGECQKEEANSKHAHSMLVQDLTDSFENAEQDIKDKTALKEEKLAKAAEDKKQLASTAQMKADDEETLSTMVAECAQKKLSFEEKQSLRADELEAIEKAIEIISSEAVSGAAEKHLAMTQSKKSGTSMLQINKGSAVSPARHHVREFLMAEGKRLNSKTLSLLAAKIAADPFAKVKKLIDAMITRLLEEANADAEKEGWCDKEMGESKVTRTKLSEEIDGLTAAIESGKAAIEGFAQEIALLTQEVSDIDKAVAEATAMREEEHAKNAATVEDAQGAKTAVESALAVLKDFYAKAGGATAFLQTSQTAADTAHDKGIIKMGTEEWVALANPAYETGTATGAKVIDPVTGVASEPKTVDKGHKAGMQTFGETYQGQQDEAGGVVALLELILGDFSSLEADTKAAEGVAAAQYEKFMTESKKSRAVKSKKIEMDEADKAAAEKKLREDIADLKATQDELLAAERYYDKLVPQCIDQGMTWEERVKAREAEIASLKEALNILSSPDIETSA